MNPRRRFSVELKRQVVEQLLSGDSSAAPPPAANIAQIRCLRQSKLRGLGHGKQRCQAATVTGGMGQECKLSLSTKIICSNPFFYLTAESTYGINTAAQHL
jgi:hypothetical protein